MEHFDVGSTFLVLWLSMGQQIPKWIAMSFRQKEGYSEISQKSQNQFVPKTLPCQNVDSTPAPRFVEKSALGGLSAIQQSDVAMGHDTWNPLIKQTKNSWQMGGAPPIYIYMYVCM